MLSFDFKFLLDTDFNLNGCSVSSKRNSCRATTVCFNSTVVWSQTPNRSWVCKIILKHRLEELQVFIKTSMAIGGSFGIFYSLMDGGQCLFFYIAFIVHIYEFSTLCNLTTEALDSLSGLCCISRPKLPGLC